MTDQQQDLKNVIENQKVLINDINELNNTLTLKRELVLKYQGIIEYLTASGVSLSEIEDQNIQIQSEGEIDQ